MKIIFTSFFLILSFTFCNAQKAFLLMENRNGKRFDKIYSGARVTVDLNNHFEYKGKMYIVNDTTIAVGDTMFSIYNIDYLLTRDVNVKDRKLVYGAICIGGGIMVGPFALLALGAYYVSENYLTRPKIFDLKHDRCRIKIVVENYPNNNRQHSYH